MRDYMNLYQVLVNALAQGSWSHLGRTENGFKTLKKYRNMRVLPLKLNEVVKRLGYTGGGDAPSLFVKHSSNGQQKPYAIPTGHNFTTNSSGKEVILTNKLSVL